MLLIEGRQSMDRADRHRIGAPFGRTAYQLLEGHAVTVTTIAGAAQAVELRRQAPAARRCRLDQVMQRRATRRCDRERKAMLRHFQLVIADWKITWQVGLGIKLQVDVTAIFQLTTHRGPRWEIPREVERLALVGSEQGRDVLGVIAVLKPG